MMRDLTINDLVRLEKKSLFPLKNLLNKPKVVQKTFEDEKGLIGSIIVNGTVELSAVFDDRSDRDKIKVMKQLYDILYKELHPKGYCDLLAFTVDSKFANILVQHFGFEYAVGHSLRRRF